MISYAPFWETLKESGESTYTLINRHRMSSSTIDKLRKNRPLNTTTINDLCRILDCPVEKIMRYVPSEDDQMLWRRSSCPGYMAIIQKWSPKKLSIFARQQKTQPPNAAVQAAFFVLTCDIGLRLFLYNCIGLSAITRRNRGKFYLFFGQKMNTQRADAAFRRQYAADRVLCFRLFFL